MKYLPCTIETFHDHSEECWVISVSAEHAAEATLEFAAMHLGRANTVIFNDGKTRFTIGSHSVTLDRRSIRVEKTWLEAVWCLFLDTHRNGWSDTAHIDQDFSDPHGSLCITIALTLPDP